MEINNHRMYGDQVVHHVYLLYDQLTVLLVSHMKMKRSAIIYHEAKFGLFMCYGNATVQKRLHGNPILGFLEFSFAAIASFVLFVWIVFFIFCD